MINNTQYICLCNLPIKTILTRLANKVLNSFSLENHIESLTSKLLASFHIMNFYNTCVQYHPKKTHSMLQLEVHTTHWHSTTKSGPTVQLRSNTEINITS